MKTTRSASHGPQQRPLTGNRPKSNFLSGVTVVALTFAFLALTCQASDLAITSFSGSGQLVFDSLDDGTNYAYRMEWAPSAAGPWSTFGGAGSWMDNIAAIQGGSLTSTVPMFYRVIAHLGDYMAINLSGGPDAESYPVSYYRTLADVPGGPNSDLYKTTSLLMRRIPKGVFTMGSPPGELGRRDTNEAQRQVTLTKDYYIGVFQVTQRQWELVMGNKPSYFTNASYYATRPVEQVSYFDIRENAASNSAISPNWPQSSAAGASSFVGKLRAKTGLSTLDLPTEAQWERAGRAGTGTALNSGKNLTNTGSCPNMSEVGRYWHNGGSWYTQNSTTAEGTAKVGSYLPNAWGLYDIHGNVREWCLDWYEAYHAATTDPVGAASWFYRMLRGGTLRANASDCRSADRFVHDPSHRSVFTGFRLARTLP